jgi:hypothetical protein
MKFTKKQRREIYEKAYNDLESRGSRNGMSFCCHVLAVQVKERCIDLEYLSENLPEFYLFKPEYICSSHSTWFDGLSGHSDRLNALLLCAELCKD